VLGYNDGQDRKVLVDILIQDIYMKLNWITRIKIRESLSTMDKEVCNTLNVMDARLICFTARIHRLNIVTQ
jgi:hypothetical protein